MPKKHYLKSFFVLLIFNSYNNIYAQLSSDFSPNKFDDIFNKLEKVASIYQNHNKARTALSITYDLEQIVKTLEIESSKLIRDIESPRNPILRTYMALSYFYLGYAKGLVGFAKEALNYFGKALKIDPDIKYFEIKIGNRKEIILNLINEYIKQLKQYAIPVKIEIITYKNDETIDPSKIQFTHLEEGELENLPSFKFYLIFALKNIWIQHQDLWKDRDTFEIYFPNGRYKLSSLDVSGGLLVQEFEFSIPGTKHIIIRPMHWFKLELPEKAKLGKNFRIFKIEDHGEIKEIIDDQKLEQFYFGHYGLKTKGKKFKCIPSRINFKMKGFTYRNLKKYKGEKVISIQDRGMYKFHSCN